MPRYKIIIQAPTVEATTPHIALRKAVRLMQNAERQEEYLATVTDEETGEVTIAKAPRSSNRLWIEEWRVEGDDMLCPCCGAMKTYTEGYYTYCARCDFSDWNPIAYTKALEQNTAGEPLILQIDATDVEPYNPEDPCSDPFAIHAAIALYGDDPDWNLADAWYDPEEMFLSVRLPGSEEYATYRPDAEAVEWHETYRYGTATSRSLNFYLAVETE